MMGDLFGLVVLGLWAMAWAVFVVSVVDQIARVAGWQ